MQSFLLKSCLAFTLLFTQFFCLYAQAQEEIPLIKIGVLSHRGEENAIKIWEPTADYLTSEMPDYQFEIVPLDFDEIEPNVANGDVDFLLTNPGIYVTMEVKHRISRIATLNNLMGDVPSNLFSGVLFARSDNQEVNELVDLEGKSLMAVDEKSLGGFQMAWRELMKVGIDPYEDLSALSFGGTHDAVVRAVKEGRVDVGTVRTNIMESLSQAGDIDPREFKILNRRASDIHPYAHSTTLYPEWPFSKLQHTPNDLAQRVAVALFEMTELDIAAQWGDYAGWSVPLDYQPVHDLLRELGLKPYDTFGQFTVMDAIRKYWYFILLIFAFLTFMSIMVTWVARLNKELAKSKQRLEYQHSLILDSVADGIYGVDLKGDSTFINKSMEEMTGWKAKELIGKNQHELLHHTRLDGSPHPANECPVYLTFKDNKKRYIEEDLFWKKSGESFPVEYSSTPMKDEHGETISSVVVFRDISLKKQVEEEARLHQKELAHVTRLSTMGEMASGMAHELNQPLTAIATNADACIRLVESDTDQREKVMDVLERISAQARRAGGIIQQLRQFVRKEQMHYTNINLNESIRDVLQLMRHELDKNEVRVMLHLDNRLPTVKAQHIQIDQVILNLVKNGMEAMVDADVDNKLLTISTSHNDENQVTVKIEDMGPGLSEEMQQKIFTPFATTKAKGMGLGLTISQGIIEAHQGRLRYESAPGKGAAFCFYLPVDNNG